MARGFETGSDNEKIDELERRLDDITDSQISSVGGNENISIDSTRGSRNNASGDSGGVRSNLPVIHQITDVDSSGSFTGIFDKINLISSMIIVDHISSPIELRFIQGTAKDGVKIKITPKVGKTLVIKSGGNILTSSDITVSDTEFYELVKHSEAETGVSGGAYKISVAQSSGGGSSPPFVDSDPLVKGSADDTKLLRFEIDGFTASTTRVITIPNSTTTMAGLTVPSQTWTGTNIFIGDVAVRTAQFFIQNTSDITKQLNFLLAGATSGFVMSIASNHTGNRTLTLPDSTTDLAGLGTLSQTWTGTNIFAGNVSMRDTNFFIQNTVDILKQLNFDLSGATSGFTLTLESNHTGFRTVTFPNSTTTLGGLATTQSWTGTNIFVGDVAVRSAQFFIQNTSDITKQLNFALAGATSGFTLTIASSHTAFRTVTLPDSTTVLAGLATTQTFAGVNTFNGNTIFNEDVTLGSSTVDHITFVGETIGDIVPNTTSIDDLGTATKKFMTAWLNFSLNLFGSFTGGQTPGFSTGQAKLFNRFNGTKYELRVLFPSGISQLISTEP